MKELRDTRAPDRSSRLGTHHRRDRGLEAVSARMLAVEETERRRAASELHEEIAQTLSAAKIKVEVLANDAGQRQVSADTGTGDEIVALVQHAIRDIRALAMDLHRPALDDFGLEAATRELCMETEETHGRLKIDSDIALGEEDLPDALKSTIYRVIQRTLKHLAQLGGIREISVVLKKEHELRLVVEFEAEDETDPTYSLTERSIPDIWERAVLAGGSLSSLRTDEGRVRYQATWVV